MRQEPGFVEDQLAHRGEIFDGGTKTLRGQPCFMSGITQLWLVAQTEEDLLASRPLPCLRHRQDFSRRHGVGGGIVGRSRKRAVRTVIAEQIR